MDNTHPSTAADVNFPPIRCFRPTLNVTASHVDDEFVTVELGARKLTTTVADASPYTQPHQRIAHKWMNLTSTLLFTLGSMFYMILSFEDYKWSQELQSLPMWSKVFQATGAVSTDALFATEWGHFHHAAKHSHSVSILHWMDTPVTRYQIVLLLGSLCFSTAGLLDIITKRNMWYSFRVLAGIFGVSSAIYVSGSDFHLYNVCNLVSVHCFLLDALTMLRHDVQYSHSEETVKQSCIYLLLGDIAYLSGTLIELVLAYLWVFDGTSDWNASATIFALIGSALWLIGSILFFYVGAGDKGSNIGVLEEDDIAKKSLFFGDEVHKIENSPIPENFLVIGEMNVSDDDLIKAYEEALLEVAKIDEEMNSELNHNMVSQSLIYS